MQIISKTVAKVETMGQLIEKTCKNCKRIFKTRDSKKDFCDLKCEEFYKDGIQVDYKEDKIEKIKEAFKAYKVCKNCGDIFYPRKKEHKENFLNRQFCSKGCAKCYYHKKRKGDKNK